MKQLKFTILLLMLLGMSPSLWAQYTFRVMASSGSSSASGKALGVGRSVNATDNITVNAKSYLSLLHRSGGTVEISKAGTYKASDLEKKLLAVKKTSTTQRYANFIIGELTKSGDKEVHKNPYKYSNVTGSVERETFKGAIVVELPVTSWTTARSYQLSWHHLLGEDSYTVTVENEFGEEVLQQQVQDTTFKIDLSRDDLQEFDMAIVKISTPDHPNSKDGFALKKAEPDVQAAYQKDMQEFKDMEENAVNNLLKAMKAEENNYLLDAMDFYLKAIKLSDNNEVYQIAYNQFLIRQSIGEFNEANEDAEKVED
ncbi:MAG: hypothetical protein AAFU64_17470 [Bacteroidota bacterium]